MNISACSYCYEYPVYHPGYCPVCPPIPCRDCAIMTMTTPYQPRPTRPNTLPGLEPQDGCRGRNDTPHYSTEFSPELTSPVDMHPHHQTYAHDAGFFCSFYLAFLFAFYLLRIHDFLYFCFVDEFLFIVSKNIRGANTVFFCLCETNF